MKYAIGIDIGGTKIAIAIVDLNGNIIAKTVVSTNLAIPPEAMVMEVNKIIEAELKKFNLPLNNCLGIGVGAPGPLDINKGMIVSPPNLPTWANFPLVAAIKESFPVDVILNNDANAAALAEKWVGSAKENETFIYLTISTGIGAGFFLDGKLFSGIKGNAGEIGHIVIDPSKAECSCGQKGCFEAIASGTAITKRGSELMGKKLTTKEIFDLYTIGNEKIVSFIENDIFKAIGIGCVTLINLLEPEKIVIGGGVSQVGEPLFKSVQDYVNRFALSYAGKQTKIVATALEQDTGVIGAAALVICNRREI